MTTNDSSANNTDVDPDDAMRLQIEPVIDSARQIADHVKNHLGTHKGLGRAARGVLAAAERAQHVSDQLKRPFGLHRLPGFFLVLSLAALSGWIYWQYFHTSQLVIAVSARDATQLKRNVGQRVRVLPKETVGSAESIRQLSSGEVDAAFIQGGVGIPDTFLRTPLEQSEYVLWFLREGIESPAQVRGIMTSSEGQGSHSVAKQFVRAWGLDDNVTFSHAWRPYTDDSDYVLDPSVDAVFVVKDPMSSRLEGVAERLADDGFRLASPDIGAMSLRLDYLQEAEIRPGFLDPVKKLPADTLDTYTVTTFLVAREGLTPYELAAARELLHPANGFPDVAVPSFSSANEVAQGVEAILGIVVYIGIAFLSLFGLDIIAYRKRFNELNTLVSLISMHQSSKDPLGGTDQAKAHRVAYLSACSDLLGLIGVITGYYAQENSSLMYNRLVGVIHERCSGLKINIQLKTLHALIDLPLNADAQVNHHAPASVAESSGDGENIGSEQSEEP